MSAVLPAALFSDGLEHLNSGTPPFLGCLPEVAGGEFRSGLLQTLLAGLSMFLGGHLDVLVLFLQVSVSNLFGQCFRGDLGDVRVSVANPPFQDGCLTLPPIQSYRAHATPDEEPFVVLRSLMVTGPCVSNTRSGFVPLRDAYARARRV